MGSFVQKISENKALSVSIFVLFLYLVPFLALGQNIPILVHDNADQVYVWYKVLAESGTIIAPLGQEIPNFLGSLPRNVLVGASEFNLILWLHALFDPFTAYVINIFVIHIVAFAGGFLLLRNHFLKKPEHKWLASGIALCFALLPFWPLGQLSIAGQPLALWAFLNIRNAGNSGNANALKAKWKSFLVLILIPFYSSFVYGFLFFLVGVGLLWLFDLLKEKKTNLVFLGSVVLMALIFVIAEYRLFFNMFFDAAYQSHRLEFSGYPGDWIKIILRGGRTFLFGSYHASSQHLPFLFAAGVLTVIVAFFKRGQNKLKNFLISKTRESLFIKLFILLILISLFDEAIAGWRLLLPLKEAVPFLRTFTLGRFKFLFPLIWFILFTISLKAISKKASHGKHIALAFIILQAGMLFSVTGDGLQSGGLGLFLSEQPTYAGFHSEKLFDEIGAFIGQPKESYRIVSLGIHPSVAQFNGFYTLDSYQNNYSLEYKHSFRRVIEKELEKSSNLQQYFDKWGSRCYLFAAELEGNAMQVKGKNGRVENLELNVPALKGLGADYVFSAVEIGNAEENSLAFMRAFEGQDSIWRIWLYKVV